MKYKPVVNLQLHIELKVQECNARIFNRVQTLVTKKINL